MDLVYYVLNIDIINTIKTNVNFNNNNPIAFIKDNIQLDIINDDIYERYIKCITAKLPPSMSSYIYVLMDNLYNNTHEIMEYLDNKYLEAYNLGLLFYGCIPNLAIIDDYLNNNIDNIKLIRQPNNITCNFYFNPQINQIPDGFNINYDTQLPFNYFFNRNIPFNDFNNNRYFKYIDGRYRPASTFLYNEYLKSLISQFNSLIQNLLNKYIDVLQNLFTRNKKISFIYNDLYVSTKIIIDKIKNIIKLDNTIENNTNFNFNLLVTQLNNINAYIFLYYYLYKPDKIIKLPEFIYYKLNSDNYVLYDKPNEYVNNEMIGGSYRDLLDQFYVNNINIINDDYTFDKENNPLPPSIEDNLELFYQLTKKKFIVDILKSEIITPELIISNYKQKLKIKDNYKTSFVGLNIAKLIEEIIKNYAEHITIQIIDNKIYSLIDNNTRLLINNIIQSPFEIKFILKNTVNSINKIYKELDDGNKTILHNLYNIADPNIVDNSKDPFIIYPNEYTNTNLLIQKYYINFNNDILQELLNKNAQPLLLDNNNNSCIHNAVKSFNYKSIKNLCTNIKFNEYNFVENELFNHKYKMIVDNNYINTFNNFIKTQYEEIKLLILANETNGNNILFNLENSFKICFYVMNEYITDYLWSFNNKYDVNKFNEIAKLLDINKNNINKNYLNLVCIDQSDLFYNDDISIIKEDFIDILNKNNSELTIQINNLQIQKNNFVQLGLSHDHIDEKITTIQRNVLTNSEKKTNMRKIISNKYTDPNIGQKDKIINTYDKLRGKGNGVYSKMWNYLLSNEQHLSNSFNLSLLKILMLQNSRNKDIVLPYLDHIESCIHDYFTNPKYIDKKINKHLTFIYDLLIHLTKSVICFGIEIITRKVIFEHLNNIYFNYSLNDINGIIDRLFTETSNVENGSFTDILYNDYPEIIVKNSINYFSSLEEKVNFEPISVNEMLQNLFRQLRDSRGIVELDNVIMNNLNKNIANYFDLFTARVIKNWFVVCENTLKFVINHQRISNTLELFS